MDIQSVVAYAFGILILYSLVRIAFLPLKLILKVFMYLVIGCMSVMAVNLVGGLFGITLPNNLISWSIIGFLGVPGLILLFLMKYLI